MSTRPDREGNSLVGTRRYVRARKVQTKEVRLLKNLPLPKRQKTKVLPIFSNLGGKVQ